MEKRLKNKSTGREWVDALIVAFILAMIIRAFFLQAYRIPTSSMEDTLLRGDHILATKYNYGMTVPFSTHKIWGADRVPKRGDVVIFTFPLDHTKDFVKRVIGLPGDEICIRDKTVYINGKAFMTGHEKHTDSNIITHGDGVARDNLETVKVEKGHVFVMGDNRDESYDSRFWGQVPVEYIKGKVLIIYFSWNSKIHMVRFSRTGHLIR
ncbi:MAG: signal peptidase I [Thermodesulfobacteriota bacterium]|nr:signal peptidase I [Thermodesulfobacteriota bacterium]